MTAGDLTKTSPHVCLLPVEWGAGHLPKSLVDPLPSDVVIGRELLD
jgi:hypothetical protein